MYRANLIYYGWTRITKKSPTLQTANCHTQSVNRKMHPLILETETTHEPSNGNGTCAPTTENQKDIPNQGTSVHTTCQLNDACITTVTVETENTSELPNDNDTSTPTNEDQENSQSQATNVHMGNI